jgi:peptidoglycan hydrolase-like protein with peptidoglycan-binding domain
MVVFTGSLTPAASSTVTLTAGGRTLGRGTTGPGGGFRIRARAGAPGPVVAHAGRAASQPFQLAVRPAVTIDFSGHAALYGKLSAVARIHPLRGHARSRCAALNVALDTRRPGSVVVTASVTAAGWLPANTTATTTIAYPQLAVGAVGSVVAELGRRLATLGYIVPPASTSFDYALLDAVYAFQKVQGLDRTGIVTPAFWAKLDHPLRPKPRYTDPADHIEVNVARQVLYVVRGGRVTAIVPVSTAGVAGDYTPRGRFAIYRKVSGFDPSPLGTLYDPMYFTGGYGSTATRRCRPIPQATGACASRCGSRRRCTRRTTTARRSTSIEQ